MVGFAKFLAWMCVLAAILTGFLRLVAIRWWQVPLDDPELAASLEPSVGEGDWLILWRLTKPSFGDLVLCPDPYDPDFVVIGRIAGEGGDRIRIQGNDVWINRRKMATESACSPRERDFVDPRDGSSVRLLCNIEVMGAKRHMRLSGKRTDRFETSVPAGEVFLVSDNRHAPFDSRDYGTIERDSCKETVIFRLMGPDGLGDVERRFTLVE